MPARASVTCKPAAMSVSRPMGMNSDVLKTNAESVSPISGSHCRTDIPLFPLPDIYNPLRRFIQKYRPALRRTTAQKYQMESYIRTYRILFVPRLPCGARGNDVRPVADRPVGGLQREPVETVPDAPRAG